MCGIMMTSTICEDDEFEKMLKEASYRTGYQLKLISVSQQNRDHPIMLNVPETDYLKFYIIQIV